MTPMLPQMQVPVTRMVGMWVCARTLRSGALENEWSAAFRQLMSIESGRTLFTHYLEGEYANENILFYLATVQLRDETDMDEFRKRAQDVYEQFIVTGAPMEVN
jgi:hypothetical protein